MLDEVTQEPMAPAAEATPVVDPAPAPTEAPASEVSATPEPAAPVEAEEHVADGSPASQEGATPAQGGNENPGLVIGYPPVAGTEASAQPAAEVEEQPAAAVQGDAVGEGSDANTTDAAAGGAEGEHPAGDTANQDHVDAAPVVNPTPAPAEATVTPEPAIPATPDPLTPADQAAQAQTAFGPNAAANLGPEVAPQPNLGTTPTAPVVGGTEASQPNTLNAILHKVSFGRLGGQAAPVEAPPESK